MQGNLKDKTKHRDVKTTTWKLDATKFRCERPTQDIYLEFCSILLVHVTDAQHPAECLV